MTPHCKRVKTLAKRRAIHIITYDFGSCGKNLRSGTDKAKTIEHLILKLSDRSTAHLSGCAGEHSSLRNILRMKTNGLHSGIERTVYLRTSCVPRLACYMIIKMADLPRLDSKLDGAGNHCCDNLEIIRSCGTITSCDCTHLSPKHRPWGHLHIMTKFKICGELHSYK